MRDFLRVTRSIGANNQLLYFPRNQFSARFGDNFFSFEITEAKIVVESCGQKYAVYVIQLFKGRNEWKAEVRFSDFATWHHFLYKCHPSIRRESPKLPPKTWFRVFDKDFLENRKNKLAAYLDSMFQVLSQHRLILDESNNTFFSKLKLIHYTE